jgi:hypothetical protein
MEKNPTPGYWWAKKENYFSVIKIVLDKEPMVMEFGSVCQIPLKETKWELVFPIEIDIGKECKHEFNYMGTHPYGYDKDGNFSTNDMHYFYCKFCLYTVKKKLYEGESK